MPLNTRNTDLINHIKNVWVKPVVMGASGNFSILYHTFSKTRFTVRSRVTGAGIEYSIALTINYPGIKDKTFEELQEFLAGDYIVVIQLINEDYYQLSYRDNPLTVNSNFNISRGIQFNFTGKQYITITCLPTFEVVNAVKLNQKLAFKL